MLDNKEPPRTISDTSGMCAPSTFDTLTYHRELREAQLDTDFNHILVQLRSEWYYTGTLVLFLSSPVARRGLFVS